MRDVTETSRFRRDLKRQKKRGKDLDKLLNAVLQLAKTGSLPSAFKPHPLTGEWKDVWDCHLESNWLLLYTVTDTEVVLYRTGTHTDLFE